MSAPNHQGGDSFTSIEKEHWEENWKAGVSHRPLSLLNVFNHDAIALLSKKIRAHVRPTVVEIGFVPGKYLQHLERRFEAICHGYDYSETGCRAARQFLQSQDAQVQVHCQDVLTNAPESSLRAKLVYSVGVVEHFADPAGMIRAHLAPLDQDGVAMILLPNYSGMNRKIQGCLDPDNLKIHNLDSMTHEFWVMHSRHFPDHEFKTYKRGHFNPWIYSLQKFGKVGQIMQFALNFLSFLIPPHVSLWAGMFVIEIRKR